MRALHEYRHVPGCSIYIDANIFLHVILNHPQYSAPCRDFLVRVERGDISATISPFVVDEVAYKIVIEKLKPVLSLTSNLQVLKRIKKSPQILTIVRPELLAFLAVLVSYKGLRILNIPSQVAVQSLQSISNDRLLPRDASHLAVMRAYSITDLATSDYDFKHVKGIRVWMP